MRKKKKENRNHIIGHYHIILRIYIYNSPFIYSQHNHRGALIEN